MGKKRKKATKRCPRCGKQISTAWGNYKRHKATHKKCSRCGHVGLDSGRIPRYATCPKCGNIERID